MQHASTTKIVVGVTSAIAAWVLLDSAVAQGDPKEIIAAQLRSQGYTCDKPKSATRDAKASKPNATVWILVCENATYRATLVPNLAAQVEVVTTDQDNSATSEQQN